MELPIGINRKVVDWLASMGYPVSGMSAKALQAMLLREARQWQVSPERLETMILEDDGQRLGELGPMVREAAGRISVGEAGPPR